MSRAINIIEDVHVELCEAEASLTLSEGIAPHLSIAAQQAAINNLASARRKIEQATIMIEKALYDPIPSNG